MAFAVKPQHFGGKLAGNTFLENAHAQPTSNDERACVFVFSPPLGQGLCHGAASVQLVVYSDANSVGKLVWCPCMQTTYNGVWELKNGVCDMQNGVWEQGRTNCCEDRRSIAEGGAGARSPGKDSEKK